MVSNAEYVGTKSLEMDYELLSNQNNDLHFHLMNNNNNQLGYSFDILEFKSFHFSDTIHNKISEVYNQFHSTCSNC